MVKIIILQRNGNINDLEISSRCKNIKTNLSKKIENKGDGNFNEIGKWDNDDYDIVLFGWNKGVKENENKHEIPPPFDDNIYYGDIGCCKVSKNGQILNFKIEDYEKFYNDKYGGLDDLLSESSSDDDDNLSINSELMREEYSDIEQELTD